MKLKAIKDIKGLKGKRVLLRADFDVPVKNGRVLDDTRIRLAMPTIKYLIKKKAIVLVIGHRGRPEGKVVKELSLEPVAKSLSKLLRQKVNFLRPEWSRERPFANQLRVSSRGEVLVKKSILSQILKAEPGEIILFENIRFDNREKKNSDRLASQLAEIAEVYVNDAFATSHRPHASILAITKYLPSFAGFNLIKEITNLEKFFKKPKRPLVVVLGGVKISTKLGVLKRFLKVANDVLLGGALANTVLRAKGVAVGKSVIEPAMVPTLKKLKLTDTKLHIPVDAVVAKKLSKDAKVRTTAIGNVKARELILDIGPDTTELFINIMKKAKTIIWNGPMGAFEYPRFAQSTRKVTGAILKSRAKVVIGGGDTLAALAKFAPRPVAKYRNVYVSTGGGAMLKFLEEGSLIALKPLMK
jgi:phosphoglycerate kinase